MVYTVRKSFTYRCDNEGEMDEILDKTLHECGGFQIVKQEKKYKQKKRKGEVIDEYYLYTIVLDLLDDAIN